ncbi:UPF0598 protein CG30010-like isoform X2 [Planococcus citri]|uniref:UPF0598 protein CG30010-like isoform X2 n=1 Tax=Planococcus citri TaxID=170843 RepID=UPI0031F7D363
MSVFFTRLTFKKNRLILLPKQNITSYTQGQSPSANTREYFYYIDHQGMLFLDDARIKNFTSCFKDKQFLHFFFKRLKKNDTDRYPDFPYLSPCGREKNYVRCDDCPVVFTHVLNIHGTDMISHNHAGNLLILPFEPMKIYVHLENGRVYHPGPKKTGFIGLVQSKLAIEFSKSLIFDANNKATRFIWKNNEYQLNHRWLEDVENYSFHNETTTNCT